MDKLQGAGGEAIDRQYQSLRLELQKARTPEVYCDALNRLVLTMVDEVRNAYGAQYGDLAHTFSQWAMVTEAALAYNNISSSKIAKGEDIKVLSNTINNQRRPHRPFPGEHYDSTGSEVSESMADAVSAFVGGRGGDFLEAESVLGNVHNKRDESFYRVATTAKGFRKQGSGKVEIGETMKVGRFTWRRVR